MGEGQMCTMKRDLDTRLCLLHDNVLPHTAEETTSWWRNLVGKALTISYSPDLKLSGFHLSPKMNEFWGGKWMATDEEVKETRIC
jgi:hypothetical protein